MAELRISINGEAWNLTTTFKVTNLLKITNLLLSLMQVILILILHESQSVFLLLTVISFAGLSVASYLYFENIETDLVSLNIPDETSENTNKISSLIKYIYSNGYKDRFNPRIYKSSNIEVDEKQWIEAISMLIRAGQATEKLELTCPNCHEMINSYIRYQDIPLEQTIGCIHCSHEFKVSEEHIIPMYSFSDNFDPMQELSMPEKYSGILAKKD
jgi:DNA-directed RNA polymerase subunit M/transcription elongation factor TFIIS